MRLKSYYSASFTQAARHPGADEVVFALSEPFLRSGEPPALKRNGSTGDRSADLYDPEMARPYQTLIAKDVEPALAQELLPECAGETQPIKLRRALRERKRPPTDAYPVPEQLRIAAAGQLRNHPTESWPWSAFRGFTRQSCSSPIFLGQRAAVTCSPQRHKAERRYRFLRRATGARGRQDKESASR